MTRKHFIALAKALAFSKIYSDQKDALTQWQTTIQKVADFCEDQNPAFNREKWIAYLHGSSDIEDIVKGTTPNCLCSMTGKNGTDKHLGKKTHIRFVKTEKEPLDIEAWSEAWSCKNHLQIYIDCGWEIVKS